MLMQTKQTYVLESTKECALQLMQAFPKVFCDDHMTFSKEKTQKVIDGICEVFIKITDKESLQDEHVEVV